MKKNSKWSRILLLALVLGVSLASLGSVMATSGVIIACIKKDGSIVNIVSSASSCGKNETAISWNITGPPGPAGPTGAQGPQGPAGVSGYQLMSSTHTATNSVTFAYTLSCPSGKMVLGGGYWMSSPDPANYPVYVVRNSPTGDGTGWYVILDGVSAVPSWSVEVWAVCANTS
jgi:hypothetical protein